VRKRLGHKEGAFSLGRFELPVAVGAGPACLSALRMLRPSDDPMPLPDLGRN